MFNFKKKNEKDPQEKFLQEHMDLFNPPSAFSGYEIVDDNIEKLTNICKLLTNNLVDMQKVNFENKYKFVDSLVELKYITSDFEQQYNLTEIISGINEVAKNLNYNIKLSAEDVMQQDDEITKQARETFNYITSHDLNICAELLEKQGYELFQVFLDCGGFNMAILPKNKIAELKQYTN